MKQIGRLWHGELALENAFQSWAVCGGVAIKVATSVLFFHFVTADRPILGFIVGYALPLPHNVVVIVGVWRSAVRYTAAPGRDNSVRTTTFVGRVELAGRHSHVAQISGHVTAATRWKFAPIMPQTSALE